MFTIKCHDCMFIFDHKARNKRYCDHCTSIRIKDIQNKSATIRKERLGQPSTDKIECLICHKYYRKPMSHVRQTHGILAQEYKDIYNLEHKGLIPEHDRDILRKHVQNNYDIVVKDNLIKKGKNTRFEDKHTFNYIRKPATLERLRKHILTITKK